MITIDDVRQLAFQLSAEDRAALASELIVSLDDGPPDPDAAALWAAEIERRAEAYARGEVTAEDAREGLERLKERLRGAVRS